MATDESRPLELRPDRSGAGHLRPGGQERGPAGTARDEADAADATVAGSEHIGEGALEQDDSVEHKVC